MLTFDLRYIKNHTFHDTSESGICDVYFRTNRLLCFVGAVIIGQNSNYSDLILIPRWYRAPHS